MPDVHGSIIVIAINWNPDVQHVVGGLTKCTTFGTRAEMGCK
jgi:hypothetical protein